MILRPLNDSACLDIIHENARTDSQDPVLRELAQAFESPDELAAFMRTRPRRLDLGKPHDGPRVACRPTQRLRQLPPDPNCFESTRMYLGLAEALNPETPRTSMTIRVGRGYHTFPVEHERPVILDPIAPRNAIDAGLYHCRPNPSRLLARPVPWLLHIAQRAICSPFDARRVANGVRSVCSNRPTRYHPRGLATLLAVAENEARLWGPDGVAAFHRAVAAVCTHIQRRELGRRPLPPLSSNEDTPCHLPRRRK